MRFLLVVAEVDGGDCWKILPLPCGFDGGDKQFQSLLLHFQRGRLRFGMYDRYTLFDRIISKDRLLQRTQLLLALKLTFELLAGLLLINYKRHQLYFITLKPDHEKSIIIPYLHLTSLQSFTLFGLNQSLVVVVSLQFNQHISRMNNLSQDDTHDHEAQGTIIVPVVPPNPKDRLNYTPKKSRRKNAQKAKVKPRMEGEYEHQESSFNDEVEPKEGERNSESKMRAADEQTMVELEDHGLIQPYQFLSQRSPSLFAIFFPRFTWRSITFWLSITYVVMFLILIIYNYSRKQTDLSWNCSLYRLQAKYFPRLRYDIQLWRIILSAVLHSNIAHFFLDLFALQVYGYFVEWYYGRVRYCIILVATAIYAHFLSCIAQKTSIATTPSAVLFAILTMKAIFLWEYRNYKKLYERRTFLYILLILIAGINLIPIFVVNNIDYSAQLGGLIFGFFFGVYCMASKEEDQTCKVKTIRAGSLLLLFITFAAFVGLVFSDKTSDYEVLADTIGPRCDTN